MSNNRLIRVFIIAQWFLLLGATIAGAIEQSFLPQILPAYRREKSTTLDSCASLYSVLRFIHMVVYATASVAMLRNKPWSRPWYVFSALLAVVLSSFMGVSAGTPIADLLVHLNLICIGGTVGLLYFSKGPSGDDNGTVPCNSLTPDILGCSPLTGLKSDGAVTAATIIADTGRKAFFKALLRNVRSGLRASCFLSVDRTRFSVSTEQLIALVGINLGLSLLMNVLRVGLQGEFNFGYLPHTLFYLPLMVVASSWMASLESRDELRLVIPISLISSGLWIETASDFVELLINDAWISRITFVFGVDHYYRFFAWWFLASFLVVRRVGGPFKNHAPSLVFLIVLALPLWFIPKWDVWSEASQDENAKEERQTIASEEIFYAQPALLEQKLGALKPGRKGVVDLYFIGFGAYAPQDVFMNEVDVVSKLFDDRFETRGRSISLINNKKTVDAVPIATRTSLERTVGHIARIMDKDEDILFLYLTSHGSERHELSVDFWPLRLEAIHPEDIKTILTEAGITWKVIVVSACYSGGYILPLHDDDTLIITSTDANNSSFGCSNDSDFTYFGKAFFDEALRKDYSFIEPFDTVRRAILKREQDETEDASNPQISVGVAIRDHLKKFEKRIRKERQ